MLFSRIALTLATLAASTFAANEFTLKTSSSSSAFNGLYVEAYHTGAGLSDPVLSTTSSSAGKFFLNDTTLLLDIGEPDTYYAVEIYGDTDYAAWQFVTINAGDGQTGFSVASNGSLLFDYEGFGGWLACDWWHGAPQLFWIDNSYDYQFPSSCSPVSLTSQAVSS